MWNFKLNFINFFSILFQEPANYQFSWEVNDPESGNDFGHQESRQGEQAQGQYYVLLADGRRQVVDYTADEDGFKPMIRYEGEASNAAGYSGAASGAGLAGYARNGNARYSQVSSGAYTQGEQQGY